MAVGKSSETALVLEVLKEESFHTSEMVPFRTTYGYIVLKCTRFRSFLMYEMVRFRKN